MEIVSAINYDDGNEYSVHCPETQYERWLLIDAASMLCNEQREIARPSTDVMNEPFAAGQAINSALKVSQEDGFDFPVVWTD